MVSSAPPPPPAPTPQLQVPPIWTQLVTLLPSKMKVNEWGLGRVKRMILNCYVEKLKTDSLAGARRHDSMLDMPPFVVDYL